MYKYFIKYKNIEHKTASLKTLYLLGGLLQLPVHLKDK